MIEEIKFPNDPENYIFTLKPRFASVYLLARAKQHYGSLDGLNIIDSTDFKTQEHLDSRKFQYMEICRLAHAIGVNHLKFIWWDKLFPDTYRTTDDARVDRMAITEAFVRFLKEYDPTIESRVNGGWIDSSPSLKWMAQLRYANIINDQLERNVESDWKTIVAWEAKSSKSTQTDPTRQYITDTLRAASQNIVPEIGRPAIWAPLINYTVTDILEEAQRHGVLDTVMQTNTCEAHWKKGRPGQCGTCRQCIIRRHTLIQAGITDTTQYDAT